MIKAPITNTGEIRYFEFIKIFVLVSFFYGLFSIFSSLDSFTITNASIYTIYLIYCLMMVIPVITLISEAIQLLKTIKSFVIEMIHLNTRVIVYIKEVAIEFTSMINISLTNYKKLCVIRC